MILALFCEAVTTGKVAVVCNEMCIRDRLRAVRDGRKFVTQADLEESVEVVIAGYQKKNKIMTDKEKLMSSAGTVKHGIK